jgi:hypothetical protein
MRRIAGDDEMSFISITVTDRATPYLYKVIEQELTNVAQNLVRGSNFLLERFKEATSPDPNFSLAELEKMGHPYGKTPSSTRMPIPHSPYWLINRQTGTLNRDLATSPLLMMPSRFFIGVGLKEHSQAQEYAGHVIFGTSKMIGRNFMTESAMANLQALRAILMRRRTRTGKRWRK